MKRLIIIAGLVIVLAIAVFSVTSQVGQQDTENESTQQSSPTVELQGTNNATQLDPTDNEIAQEAIQDMVKHNEPDSTQQFTAVVRQDSIVRSTTSYGEPKLQYLVDIPELQRTFIVEREGDDSSSFASIYVRCPSDTDLRYPAKTCTEIE